MSGLKMILTGSDEPDPPGRDSFFWEASRLKNALDPGTGVKSESVMMSAQFGGQNIINRQFVYNSGDPFSGPYFAHPRLWSGRTRKTRFPLAPIPLRLAIKDHGVKMAQRRKVILVTLTDQVEALSDFEKFLAGTNIVDSSATSPFGIHF